MSNFFSMPWQLRIEELFTRQLPAPDVEKRDPYRRQDDVMLHSPAQNSSVRIRSYESDGHDYRQELVTAAGNAVGQVLQGSDRELGQAMHTTFSDVIVKISSALHFRTDKNNLLWNYVPFNPKMNPTFQMPPGLSTAEDAFQFAKASAPGAETIGAVQSMVKDFSASTGADGFADFSSPFASYCTLTPTKIPQWNYAAIMFMQLLFQGAEQLWLCAAPGAPLVPAPKLIALLPLIKQNYDTIYGAGIQGKVIGKTVKSLLLSAVPGMNLLA